MPNIIIGIITCDKHAQWRQACEDTWVNHAQKLYTVVWAAGDHEIVKETSTPLLVVDEHMPPGAKVLMAQGKPDTYYNLPYKVQGLCDYALAMGADWLLKVDNDTFLYPSRLKPPNKDYAGMVRGLSDPRFVPPGAKNIASYCSGGIYWLSRRAMRAIVRARVNDIAEDRWVGNVLHNEGLFPQDLPEYHCVTHKPVTDYNLDPKLVALTALTEPREMYMLFNKEEDKTVGVGAHYSPDYRPKPQGEQGGAHYKGK